MSEPKPKAPRASTSSKNRTTRSPSPYRSRAEQSIGDFVNDFWQHTINVAEQSDDDFKHQALPLARIKKVMKSDPEVRMISSEVTVLFEKACQIFIQELTARSHLVSLSSRRRTLSRPDVAQAILKSDMFDFLIDIVPREEGDGGPGEAGSSASTKKRGKGKGKGKGKKREVEVDEEEEEPRVQRRRVEEEGGQVEELPGTLLEQLQRSKEALVLEQAMGNGSGAANGSGQGYAPHEPGHAPVGLNWTEGFDYSNASHFYPHPE